MWTRSLTAAGLLGLFRVRWRLSKSGNGEITDVGQAAQATSVLQVMRSSSLTPQLGLRLPEAIQTKIIASSAASHSNGVLRQRLSKFTGGANAVSVVENDAVHDAPADEVAPFGVHVTAVPRFVEPFWNCTVPVGP